MGQENRDAILYVDDDERWTRDIGTAVSEAVEKTEKTIRVLTARNGEEALRIIETKGQELLAVLTGLLSRSRENRENIAIADAAVAAGVPHVGICKALSSDEEPEAEEVRVDTSMDAQVIFDRFLRPVIQEAA